ncbi:MAG: hypothetical protein EOP05_13260 [Proteobacteria bacterium]|nr:MAG: hypothetical protein EOP05_13260 [Pseudomonadota bacterium]
MKSKRLERSMPQVELEKFRTKISNLSNSVRFDEARALCLAMAKRYEKNAEFLFMEAVYEAEDDTGFTPKQVAARHARAAAKIKKLFPKIRSLEPRIRGKMRNEYYWFSHQPKKQYELGRELVAKGNVRSNYSQGVGAVEVAKVYANEGKHALCVRWAKKSELAWKKFFKSDPSWFNAYFFYAMALGYQNRFEEMDAALLNASKYAGKPKSWDATAQCRREIMDVVAKLNSAK